MTPPSNLRWDDLRVFLLLCRTGTLTATASALGVAPSTAQRRLNALERALGARLFDRSAGGLSPTAAGESMRPLASQVEDDVDALLRAVAGQDLAPRGTVHLTAPEPLLPLLVEPLACFRRRFPAIQLKVSFSDRHFDLTRREADVAVRPSPGPPEDAVGRKVGPVSWAVYGSTHARGPGPVHDLPWAVYGGSLGRLAAARWWKTHHGQDAVLLSVNSVSAMHRVTACSACRGLLPCFVGDPDPHLERLSAPIDAPESSLWVLLHPDLRRATRVRALVDHLWDTLLAHRSLLAGRSLAVDAASIG